MHMLVEWESGKAWFREEGKEIAEILESVVGYVGGEEEKESWRSGWVPGLGLLSGGGGSLADSSSSSSLIAAWSDLRLAAAARRLGLLRGPVV